MIHTENPFEAYRTAGRVCVLDGGLATALETRGCVLNDDLWSARVLVDQPGEIRAVHRAFLQAGADCITSASYQASFPGFAARGLDEREATRLLQLAVTLAREERAVFWDDVRHRTERWRPLVAASVGPYGAFLADGSEYRGRYGIDAAALRAFHAPRWRVLAATEADLLACETLPDALEVEVLLQLLADTTNRWAWFSCCCRDERHLYDGTPLRDVVRACNTTPGVAAVGINCTAPELISPLIEVARAATDLPVIVYPNSGDRYDAVSKSWAPGEPFDWSEAVREWISLGVTAVGGCCRVGPETIGGIRSAMQELRRIE